MTPAAFDAVAAKYDAAWTGTAIGRAQRALVWREIDELFGAGDCVLDIGCGTGEDAAHLAGRDVVVHATDASREMVRIAASRGGFTTEVASAEEIVAMPGSFDGALSNFGAVNCVEHLGEVAKGLAAQIRAGGAVAVCVIGRFCLWEAVYYGMRLRFRKALRRVLQPTVTASLGVRVHYRSVRELRAAFAPEFECKRWLGVGVLVPPSYVGLPDSVVRVLSRIDRVLSRVPVLRGLADHRLLILVRR